MRLYHVSSEKNDRWVIGRNANNAREIAIKEKVEVNNYGIFG